MQKNPLAFIPLVILFAILPARQAAGQSVPLIDPQGELPQALNGAQTKSLIRAVDRGLSALQQLQNRNGSFRCIRHGQPGVTALAVMAFLSRGHKPGEGPYGETLNKAIDYVLAQQKPSGLFAATEIDRSRIHVRGPWNEAMISKSYTHAISMLMLGEVYGLTEDSELFRLREAIDKGLKFTIQLWDIRKGSDMEEGGFRYTQPWHPGGEGDMSVTGWHVASLRSIRNAGFDVPRSVVDRIARYVLRNQRRDGGFAYIATDPSSTFAMTGAGTLCLALAGKYDHPATRKAGAYLARFDAQVPRNFQGNHGRRWPYYTCYYLTQASIQVGGKVWLVCMRESADYLLQKQESSGFWRPDGGASSFGTTYSTSMAIISLTPHLQLLPIYQR